MEPGIVCFFDGACGPSSNGGNMGLGAAIFINQVQFDSYSEYIRAHESNSNNVAEYGALIWLLEALIKHGLNDEPIVIYGDSMMVIMQMTGKWKIKGGLYYDYALQAKSLLKNFYKITFKWIPREQNGYADSLSKLEFNENENDLFKTRPVLNTRRLLFK